jgi:endonuclease/exonuclease/phosphatase family metal-dependent hydrolase
VNDVRVGSFNISSVSADASASGDHEKWPTRRRVVAEQIINNRLDVVGLQEANQSSIYSSSMYFGVNQYMDLLGALRVRGAQFAVTNAAAYNCVKSTSTYKCEYQNRQASQDNRIIYNTDRVSLVRQGAVRYPTQTAGKNERYLVWAVFAMKATGKQFLFTDTHLDPYSNDTRRAQWDEAIATTNALKGDLPVVAVGDYNTSKFDDNAAAFLPKMRANGYGDVLNQQYQKPVIAYPRAETTSMGWVNSFNAYRRDMRSYSYYQARYKTGNGVDWIFATNALRVKRWALVTRVDARTLQLTGVIGSDHSLVTATLVVR